MDLEQAKTKVDSISKSTALKHPKVLVAELCTVVKFLLEEIDRIKSPIMNILPKRFPENFTTDTSPPERRYRNAGDAECSI